MAGVMVRRGDRQRVPLGNGTYLVQKLREVLDLVGEYLGPLCVLGVVARKVRVLLHRRAAAGGVDDHVVEVLGLEGVYGPPREVQGLLLAPGMGAQGTTAALVLGGDGFATLGGQHPDGGGVDL